MGGQVVQHHPDPRGLRIIDIDQLAHALGEVSRRALLCDLDLAPEPVRVEDHEHIEVLVDPECLPVLRPVQHIKSFVLRN